MILACLAFLVFLSSSRQVTGHPSIARLVASPENTWAVLVATSSGYINYRHQADVCHAYQVLKSHGIAEDRTIVMMVDDIAQDWQNTKKGIIINEVGGRDVYRGVPKHFTGDSVTSETFLKVLKGDADLVKQGHKVLNSTEKDNVFIYLVDHGLPGIIAFPHDELYADQLVDTLHDLKKSGKFANLVIYTEACYSGSMFQDLLSENSSIFAVTSANAEELSYSCCWDNKVKAFVGDEFSSHWINQAELVRDPTTVSIGQQVSEVTGRVVMSHVSTYGDRGVTKRPVGEFQGFSKTSGIVPGGDHHCTDRVASTDVPIETIKKQIEEESDDERLAHLQHQLDELLEKQRLASMIFDELKNLFLAIGSPDFSRKID